MRILITGRSFASFRGGELGLFEEDQARALSALGHDVRFAAMDTRSLRRLRPLGLSEYESRGLWVFACAVPVSGMPGGLGKGLEHTAAERLWRAVTADGWRPEVIHGHFGAAFAPLAKAQGIPFVYTEHFSGRNRILPQEEAEALRQEYARVSCLLAVSGALRENIRRNTGVIARVVPNIVDTVTFQPRQSPHTPFRFVTTANLVPIKGLDVLLEAFAMAGIEGGELTIFGDGPEKERLSAIAAERGVLQQVRFRGACPRETLAEEYARSDCFVLSSRSETFGLACAEALSSGLPVISSRCGGPEDFVNDGNGLLVPVDHPQALASAMREMAAGKKTYDTELIAARAREQFSPAAVAKTLTAIYQEQLGERKEEEKPCER